MVTTNKVFMLYGHGILRKKNLQAKVDLLTLCSSEALTGYDHSHTVFHLTHILLGNEFLWKSYYIKFKWKVVTVVSVGSSQGIPHCTQALVL